MNKRKPKSIEVPMDLYIPDSLSTKFANNLAIQHTEYEFMIFFFEAKPPLIAKNEEESLKKIKAVQNECVAKIVITANRFPEFVKAFQTNLDQFNKKFGKEKK